MNTQIQIAEEDEGAKENEMAELNDGIERDVRPFDIGDHIDRLLNMMGLSSCDGGPESLSELIKRMTEPAIIDALPFGNQTLDDDDKKKLDDVHHKMVIVIGRGGDGIDVDDIDEVRDIAAKLAMPLADVRNVNVRMGSAMTSSAEAAADASKSLTDAFNVALRCADVAKVNDPPVDAVASMIRSCRHTFDYGVNIDDNTKTIVAGVVSDLSSYIPTPGFFRNVADRIKDVYHSIRSKNDHSMEKQAFVTLRHPVEDFTGRQDVNICPKFKSHQSSKAAVPVEHSYCRDYCIEGRPEPDGTVTCKYAEWLSTIDGHEKAMARYPEQKNPNNADMALRLKDGERNHPRKKSAVGIEERMQKAKRNDAKPDGTKSMERLIEELVNGTPGRQDDEGRYIEDSTERQLRSAETVPLNETTEPRLDDKRDDTAHGVGPENAMETRLRKASPEKVFDHMKLLDELLEDEFPRDGNEQPEED